MLHHGPKDARLKPVDEIRLLNLKLFCALEHIDMTGWALVVVLTGAGGEEPISLFVGCHALCTFELECI